MNIVTVEEFRQMPEQGEYEHELHFGEVVAFVRPKQRHLEMRHRLYGLLRPRLAWFGVAAMVFPYRAVPEFDLRVADVAVVARERWDSTDSEDNLHGAPDLVIEVKSPSNTAPQLRETAAICLATGAREFWIVDPYLKSIAVIHRDGIPAVFESGASLSLANFGGSELSVDEIFA